MSSLSLSMFHMCLSFISSNILFLSTGGKAAKLAAMEKRKAAEALEAAAAMNAEEECAMLLAVKERLFTIPPPRNQSHKQVHPLFSS